LKLTKNNNSNQHIELLNADIVKTVLNADEIPETKTSLKIMAEMRRRNEYILLKELNNRKSCLADLYKLEKKGLDLKYYYQKEILKTTDKTMKFGSVIIEFLENPKFVRIRDKTKE
jgi:predicted HTH domain antitoxin